MSHRIDKDTLLKAFPLLFTDKWPVGCHKPPTTATWAHWEAWLGLLDSDEFWAFSQLVCFGDTIYGA